MYPNKPVKCASNLVALQQFCEFNRLKRQLHSHDTLIFGIFVSIDSMWTAIQLIVKRQFLEILKAN